MACPFMKASAFDAGPVTGGYSPRANHPFDGGDDFKSLLLSEFFQYALTEGGKKIKLIQNYVDK